MRSPFAPFRRWFSEVLEVGSRLVHALGDILEAIHALDTSIRTLGDRESARERPSDNFHVEAIQSRIDDLTLAVKEGVNNVQRSERRVRAIVASARRELAEAGYSHAGLDAEASELREVNGDRGEEEEVPTVPEVVGDDSRIASPIPGVTVAQMRLARARRR